MVMKALRVFLAILYSAAFIFSLSRCSPNAASLDKSLLRALHQEGGSSHGGVNMDANLKFTQPALKLHFVSRSEFRSAVDSSKTDGEVRVHLLSNDRGTGDLDVLRRTGEAELHIKISRQLYPVEAWIRLESQRLAEQAESEGCSIVILPAREGAWRISLGESSECKSRQEILSRAEEILISFRAKDPIHLIDSVTAPEAP